MTAVFDTVATRNGSIPVLSLRDSLGDVPTTLNAGRGPHKNNLGVTGTQIQMGIIHGEEFNPELSGKAGIRTWETMRRVEPQINSTLLMMELPIRSAEWKIAPGTSSPEDVEIASFVETCLFHTLRRPWDDVLRHALLHLTYGFMLFEQTFRNENGRTVLNDLAPRLPRTVHRWWTDPKTNDLTGIQQWVWKNNTYEFIDIPTDVLIHLAHRQEGQNYEGISVLRTAYKPYWYKQNLERIQSVGFERQHVGIPKIIMPEGFTKNDLEMAEKIGRNMRSHETAFITVPPTWDVDWLKASSGEKKGGSIQDTLYYLDRQIQQNVLAQFMSLGTTDVGSYALSNDQSRVFLMSLQATARYIANTINKNTVTRLVNYNYQNVAIYPELIIQKIHAYNFMDLTTAIANLVGSGVLPVTLEMEDFLYDILGIPMPPRNVVETTNPIEGQRGHITTRPDSNLATPGEQKDEGASGVGFHEVYRTSRFTEMAGPQRKVYARMAREAGRPQQTLRFSNGHQWVSPTREGTRHDSISQRRLQISDELRRRAEATVAELTAQVEENE